MPTPTSVAVTFNTEGFLNGKTVAVVAAFEPSGAYSKFTPIVWRAQLFQPNVSDTFSGTWTTDLAFSALDDTSADPADTYIQSSEQTELSGDTTKGFTFSSCVPAKSAPGPKCFNMTGGKANIGFGFFYDMDGPNEELDIVAAYTDVGAGKTVVPDKWYPNLVVYVSVCDTLPVQEGGSLKTNTFTAAEKVFSKDLRKYTGDKVTLDVSWDDGAHKYVVDDGAGFASAFLASQHLVQWPALGRTLDATIFFSDQTSDRLTYISEELGARGYVVDVVKCGDDVPYGKVSLTIPRGMSCDEAKSALEDVAYGGVLTTFTGKLLWAVEGTFHAYVNINPATPAWFDGRVDPLPSALAQEGVADAAFESKANAARDAMEKVSLAAANGNTPAVMGNDVMPRKRQATLAGM